MALLHPHALDCAAAIGVHNQRSDGAVALDWIGTGFFVAYPCTPVVDGKREYATYFVTAKHLVVSAIKDGALQLVLRSRTNTGEAAVDGNLLLKLKGSDAWRGHPNGDLAVFPYDHPIVEGAGLAARPLQIDQSCFTVSEMRAAGLSEGDGVFVVGYPLGLVADSWPGPIVRGGTVARIRDVYADPTRRILIDSDTFPGASGAPVFNRPDASSVTGTLAVRVSKCIGMVTQARTWEDVAVSQQTGHPRITFIESAGLADVEPFDRVIYVIERHLDGGKARGESAAPRSRASR